VAAGVAFLALAVIVGRVSRWALDATGERGVVAFLVLAAIAYRRPLEPVPTTD